MTLNCRAVICRLLLIVSVAIGSALADDSAMPTAGEGHELFRELLRLPNDALKGAAELDPNFVWMKAAFDARGFKTEPLPTSGYPLLLASRQSPDADQTILIYLQIDGQPVDATQWRQDDPYEPTLKEMRGGKWVAMDWDRIHDNPKPDWRIFARSASDAKGPAAAFLHALDILDASGSHASFHIKVVMDFEEELGSPHLPDAVTRHENKLSADGLIIFDGPRHPSNQSTIALGARGISTVTLTVHGPRVAQHSGHYGNYIPNPAMRLARLLASMTDADGRVVIPGFYDGVELDDRTRASLRSVPDDESAIRRAMGVKSPDKVAGSLQASLQYPSLNVRGLQSAWVGAQVRTIIPATATAEIDVRLVVESDPERLLGLIRNHIRDQGFTIVDGEPTYEDREQYDRLVTMSSRTSYRAFRTPVDAPLVGWLESAIASEFGEPPIRIRTMGGSIPISPFVVALDIPAVSVPTVNPDNNQHSPNENIRLGNFDEAVRTFGAILTQPFD